MKIYVIEFVDGQEIIGIYPRFYRNYDAAARHAEIYTMRGFKTIVVSLIEKVKKDEKLS